METRKTSKGYWSAAYEIVSLNADETLAVSNFAEAHFGTSTENTIIGSNISDAGARPSNSTSTIIKL